MTISVCQSAQAARNGPTAMIEGNIPSEGDISMRRTSEVLLAVITAVALVILGAAPSAANVGIIGGGTITADFITLDLYSTSTDPNCENGLTIDVDDYGTASTGTAGLTIKSPFVYNGINYVFEIPFPAMKVTLIHLTGFQNSIWMTGLTTIGFTVTTMKIFNATGFDSCTRSSTTPKCSAMAANFSTGMTGMFTGTIDPTSPHDLLGATDIDVTAPLVAAGCTPPFSTLNGATLTITSMSAYF